MHLKSCFFFLKEIKIIQYISYCYHIIFLKMLRKVLAINAARKNFSTAQLLKKALEGAQSVGAQTEIIHLHDYNVNGCRGCMACKMLKNVPPKSCLQRDELSPILEKAVKADALIVGGPIYMWQPGGYFRCFSERLLYPYLIYGSEKNYFPNKKEKCAVFFSMGAPKEMYPQFKKGLDVWEQLYQRTFNSCEVLRVYRTWHVHDFPKYQLDCLNEPERKKYNDETWDQSLEQAYQIGKKLGKE